MDCFENFFICHIKSQNDIKLNKERSTVENYILKIRDYIKSQILMDTLPINVHTIKISGIQIDVPVFKERDKLFPCFFLRA